MIDRPSLGALKSLHWLVERGGNGVRTRRNGVLAAGEMRGAAPAWTWTGNAWRKLERAGLIERVNAAGEPDEAGMRVRVTALGYEIDQRNARVREQMEMEAMLRLLADDPDEMAEPA